MSAETRQEVLARLRRWYARAGRKRKAQLLDQATELFGYHRKAAIRALRGKALAKLELPAVVMGRPKEYSPERLLPVIKPIWFAAFQPCGKRLKALLPEWLPAFERERGRLDADLSRCILEASPRTLDRLVAPLRVAVSRRGGTKPGSLLRQSIPIRGEWTEEGSGWMEFDTVALCGGALDDLHAWMLDGVDIASDWVELRATENRGQHSVVAQLKDIEENLPFTLLGVDTDNGGEFINHHLVRYLQLRPKPVLMTRSRPYKKNDNAHVEQRNWTHVRQHFGYERYDNPEVVPMINALCKGPLGQLLNHFLPTQKLSGKTREGNRTIRHYGPAGTPYQRLLNCPNVTPAKKAELKALHNSLNPIELRRQVDQGMRRLEKLRLIAS